MIEDGTHGALADQAEQPLDPFGLVPDWRSKVRGIGGSGEAEDLNYAFHTVYVPVAEGHAHFRLRFHNLQGKLGTMVLRVHMYQRGVPNARLATSERILLSRLVQLGGVYQLRFEAFHGVTYAFVGALEGMSDATADALEVVLDRPGDENAPTQAATEARNSAFGRDAVRAAPAIISAAKATLADPVSQRCTAAQLSETAFLAWSRRLGDERADPLDRWCTIYVLQVLERYGVLRPGAAGLGIGARDGGVAKLAAAAGAAITMVDPEVAADARAEGGSTRHVAGSLADLPRDFVNFDFLWSERTVSRAGSAAEGVRLVDQAMRCLRPGGLAVHVVDFAMSPESAAEEPGIAPWQRRELDRLALILISRGHDVAEIRVDEHRAPTRGGTRRPPHNGITAAGLIARKARTIE